MQSDGPLGLRVDARATGTPCCDGFTRVGVELKRVSLKVGPLSGVPSSFTIKVSLEYPNQTSCKALGSLLPS